MGLLDKAKEETNKYISPEDFLCFLSYRLDEPLKDVVSFLLYNRFDELVCEYYIDDHYRIYDYKNIGRKYKTSMLLNEIAKDGFLDYMLFYHRFYDEDLGNDELNLDLDYYEPIKMDFYYSLEQLQKLVFIKELNLPLEESNTLDYTIDDNHNNVIAKESKDNIRSIVFIDNSISEAERAKLEQDVINEYGENSQAHNFHKLITMASRGELPQRKTGFKSDKQIINELQEQVAQLTTYRNKAQDKVAELENQLAQAKTEIEDKSANDEPTHHKSVGSMQVLVTTLIKMAEYDKEHLADPYGELNRLIQAKAEGLELSVKKDFIAKWLKKADEVL